MAKHELSRELYLLSRFLGKSILILLRMYGPFLKPLLLTLLAYLAFRLGRKTVVDQLEEDSRQIKNTLENRVRYTVHLPQTIKRASTVKRTILALLVLSVAAAFAILHFKVKFYKGIKTVHWLQAGFLGFLFLGAVWTYELMLGWQLQKGRALCSRINEELFALTKLMGAKGDFLLRTYLCKDKLLAKQKRSQNTCWKDQCRQERSYLRIRSELIEQLVQAGLTSEWCSVCSRRQSFDEYLQFEGQVYSAPPALSPDEEVGLKNQYLLSQLERNVSWIRNIAPCNCSKIYWFSQLRQIKIYKEQEKQLEEGRQIAVDRRGLRVMR